MIRHLFLDSSPLSLLASPLQTPPVIQISRWAMSCYAAGHKIYVPEIIDYEVRRELLRARKTKSIFELDRLQTQFRFIPLTTPAMLLAADLWAQVRQAGQPTADQKHLDVDVILAAQVLTLDLEEADRIIVTTNVAHLSRFVPADTWQNIVA